MFLSLPRGDGLSDSDRRHPVDGFRSPLFECNTQTDDSVFERALAVDPDDAASLDPSELPFLLGQLICPREVQLDHRAPTNRRGHWNRNEDSHFAYVGAAAVEKAARIGKPHADRPRQIRPNLPALLH